MKKSLLERFQKLAGINELDSIGEQGPRPSDPPTEEEFKKLLSKELKDNGYSDEEIAKLHPLIWIVIGTTFVKWLDNQIDDE